MNIKRFFGLQTVVEMMAEYRECRALSRQYRDKGDELAKSFREMSVLNDTMFKSMDGDEASDAMERYHDFIKGHVKSISDLKSLVDCNDSKMKSLESEPRLKEWIDEIKTDEMMKRCYDNRTISKSVYFDYMKSKGPVKYADVVVKMCEPEYKGTKILILQRTDDLGNATDKWCIPGGHVDGEEDFRTAARRELFEETGLDFPADRFIEDAVYKNEDADIHYFSISVTPEEAPSIVVDGQEECGSAWIEVDKIDDYDFIFDMKKNLRKIMGLDNSFVKVLKAYSEGVISKSIFDEYCEKNPDEVQKAKNKTDFSGKEREELADKGEAMPNGKYPIRNEQDLHDAIKLVGASSMPESEVKAWIEKRAKALGLTDKLPESWGHKKEEKVEKAEMVADARTLAKEDLKPKVVGPQGSGVEDDAKVEKSSDEKGSFLAFINFLQGMATRKDNLHWSELDNSQHVYLDEVGDQLSDFKDTLAESGQALFGRFEPNTVNSETIEETDPLAFMKLLFRRTTAFRKSLEGKDDYFGELSYIDDFLIKTKQSIYRLQMH